MSERQRMSNFYERVLNGNDKADHGGLRSNLSFWVSFSFKPHELDFLGEQFMYNREAINSIGYLVQNVNMPNLMLSTTIMDSASETFPSVSAHRFPNDGFVDVTGRGTGMTMAFLETERSVCDFLFKPWMDTVMNNSQVMADTMYSYKDKSIKPEGIYPHLKATVYISVYDNKESEIYRYKLTDVFPTFVKTPDFTQKGDAIITREVSFSTTSLNIEMDVETVGELPTSLPTEEIIDLPTDYSSSPFDPTSMMA